MNVYVTTPDGTTYLASNPYSAAALGLSPVPEPEFQTESEAS